MPTKVAVHLGPHRTGTTAFQEFMRGHPDELAANGWTYPRGLVEPDQHLELTFLTIRPERLADATPFFDHLISKSRADLPASTDPAWSGLVDELVTSVSDGLLLSAEALSWIRFDDEIERFLKVFDRLVPSVVFVRRRPEDFIESYYQVSRFMTLKPPDGPDSLWYVGENSWLIDYDTRIDLWRRHLGADRVTVVDYDDAVRLTGTSVSAVAQALGIETASWDGRSDRFVNRRRDLPGYDPTSEAAK